MAQKRGMTTYGRKHSEKISRIIKQKKKKVETDVKQFGPFRKNRESIMEVIENALKGGYSLHIKQYRAGKFRVGKVIIDVFKCVDPDSFKSAILPKFLG